MYAFRVESFFRNRFGGLGVDGRIIWLLKLFRRRVVIVLTGLDHLKTGSTVNLSIPKECNFIVIYSNSVASLHQFSCLEGPDVLSLY
jgi:hypothetical protein